MSQDFDCLEKHLIQVIEQHSDISHELKEQAELASIAKEKNDKNDVVAVDMKNRAKVHGAMAISGVALVGAPIQIAKRWADKQNHPVAKVAAGAGGAVVGLVVGVDMTIMCPISAILAGIYGALALVYSNWSTNFKDLTQKILEVEKLIATSTLQLTEIRSSYQQLREKVSHYEKMDRTGAMAHQFRRIIRACKDVIKSCDSYLDDLQPNGQKNSFLMANRDE